MEIVHFTQEDELEVVDLWNKTCTADPIHIDIFRQKLLYDDNFDSNLCWVAKHNNRVVGFICATKRKFPYLERGLEPDKGWINIIFVDPDFQCTGIGSQLLKVAEKSLIDLGCTKIILASYSPGYFFWGVDTEAYSKSIIFFTKHGYDTIDVHYSMAKDLHGFKLSEDVINKQKKLEDKGFTFKPFEYQDSLELLEFVKNEFGGGWKRNCLMSMQQKEAENRILVVKDKSNKICGFAHRGLDNNPMRFGPIGVGKNYRNEGLGSVLLELAALNMAKRGIVHMFFLTTDELAKPYYLRHGFYVIRKTIAMEKIIK